MGIYLEILKTSGLLGLIQTLRPRTLFELTPEEKALAEKFKRGVAQALGVPPEWINEEIVERWITQWARAFVKPEHWKELGIA